MAMAAKIDLCEWYLEDGNTRGEQDQGSNKCEDKKRGVKKGAERRGALIQQSNQHFQMRHVLSLEPVIMVSPS